MESLFANDVLAACVYAWLVAQLSKPLIHYVHSRRVNLRYFVTAGGMPSSHPAGVGALATRGGVRTGLSSLAFPLATGFSAVVMYDAAGVRPPVTLPGP